MSNTKLQNNVNILYQNLLNEKEEFTSAYDDYMFDNPVIVDFGNFY